MLLQCTGHPPAHLRLKDVYVGHEWIVAKVWGDCSLASHRSAGGGEWGESRQVCDPKAALSTHTSMSWQGTGSVQDKTSALCGTLVWDAPGWLGAQGTQALASIGQ